MTELRTGRLRLVLMTLDDVDATLAGESQVDWTPGYPTEGDVTVARMIAAHPAAIEESGDFGHRRVRERASGLVVGGIGFFGPPQAGIVEIGYGIAPERRGRGVATEAMRAMVAFAWTDPRVAAVRAETSVGNVASVRVLEKAGLVVAGRDGDTRRYELSRPLVSR